MGSANSKPVNFYHKLSSDDQISSLVIEKGWYVSNFLDHFREAIEQ